jgi:hypothetical protein
MMMVIAATAVPATLAAQPMPDDHAARRPATAPTTMPLTDQNSGHGGRTAAPSAAARLAAAERVCQMLHDQPDGAPVAHEGVEHSYLWSMRRMEAQRDVDAARGGDRFAALEAHLQRMRDVEKQTAELYKAKVVSKFDMAATQYYVVEAEELLARERAK